MREEDSHGAALWLIDGYDVFVIDTYSCDRPWLVEHRAPKGVVKRETMVVSEKLSPAPECAIIFGVRRFVSQLVTRRVSYCFADEV